MGISLQKEKEETTIRLRDYSGLRGLCSEVKSRKDTSWEQRILING
jgi:hypothetical protein